MLFYAILARLLAGYHALQGHKVLWWENRSDVCGGDISCVNCNLTFWCRWFDPKWMGGRKGFDEDEAA